MDMRSLLAEKLHSYIVANNPDLLLSLQGTSSVTKYIEEKINSITSLLESLSAAGKPDYIIEEQCMYHLTMDLRPSKYNYVKEVFEEEFEKSFEQFRNAGVLTYEIVNMIQACNPVFDQMGFSEDRSADRKLRYAITGTIQEYLESK